METPSFNKILDLQHPSGTFSLTLSMRGSQACLALIGKLDAATTAFVETELMKVLDGKPTELIFDLGGLRYVTSIGYRLFLIATRDQRAAGGTVSYIHVQPQIQDVFSIMGSLTDMHIFASIDELDQYLLRRQANILRGE